MRFDSALSLWCGRTGFGCCSCGLAPLQVLLLLVAAAAGLTHQGMREETAGRKQEADTVTALVSSAKPPLSSGVSFFFFSPRPTEPGQKCFKDTSLHLH